MNNINIICYHEVDKLLNYVKQFDVSENPFLSYAFLSVYLKYFPQGNYYFFNIFENEKIIGIVPFECTFESSLLNFKKFRFIGYRFFNYEQYICLNNDMKKVHTLLMSYLNKQEYSIVLNFYDINSESPLYSIINVDNRIKKKLELYSCPCLRFSENFDAFFRSVYSSSKKRSELKKFQKKVSELGNFRIVNIEDGKGYNKYLFYINQIYKVHSERFAGVYATSFFGSERMRPFYSELIKSLMFGEKAHISLLILDDVVIAFIFCLTNGKTLIDWIPAFDPAFSKYSLGIVQYKMLFEEICNQGKYNLFDYSKGSSVYKRKWAKEETHNYQFIIKMSSLNPFAFLAYIYDNYRFSLKVYLRRKGVLSFIKHKIGVAQLLFHSNNRSLSVKKISYIDQPKEKNCTFNYGEISNLSVGNRELILTALYHGKKLISVTDDKIIISN